MDLFDFTETNGQQMVTVRYDMIVPLFAALNVEVEVSSYTDKAKILSKLHEGAAAPEPYFFIAQTGNNPYAPYQWVGIMCDENAKEDTVVNVSNPDNTFSFVDFRPKDITQLITVKVLKTPGQ